MPPPPLERPRPAHKRNSHAEGTPAAQELPVEPVTTAVETPDDKSTEPGEQEAIEETPPVQELPAEPVTAAVETYDQKPAEPGEPEASADLHHDLIIEALPNLRLTEPILVTMDELGDTIFTGTVSALNLSTTGTSSTNALFLLKEQIETLYGELDKKTNLDSKEKEQLGFLRHHIASQLTPKRSWF